MSEGEKLCTDVNVNVERDRGSDFIIYFTACASVHQIGGKYFLDLLRYQVLT